MKIVLIPSSQGCLEKNQGCESAPAKIMAELTAEGGCPGLPCTPQPPAGTGDVVPNSAETVTITPNNLEETNQAIFEKALALLGQEKVLFLGGDHSITYPLFKAFAEKFQGKKIGLVCFDAHADCAQNFSPPSHEDWLRVLVEDKVIAPENALFIGTRKIFEVEKEWLEKNQIKFLEGNNKIELKSFLEKFDAVYLSIDIDVFDPALAPGTGYLEKNGLQEKEFFELLETITGSGKVEAVDLVEANPKKDEGGKTIELAAKITGLLIQPS